MLPIFLAINFGAPELIIALALVVLLFGATKIPELARSLGKAKGEYQKAVREGEHEPPEDEDAPPKNAAE